MRHRPLLPALLAVAALSSPAAGQLVSARAPGGALTGVVRDSMTGLVVGYALVTLVERNQRVFATESGRFTLSGLVSGRATLRVQQIGYRPVSLTLSIDAAPGPPTGAADLVVRLGRHVVVLPEILVEGDVCSGERQRSGEAREGVLGEMFQNAERLRTLQEEYPFREVFEETTNVLDSLDRVTSARVDTGRYDSRQILRYRPGQVIELEGRARVESARYFQPADLARDEFRRNHCFWYSGLDSLYGFRALRIEFAPLKKIKTVDWAGSLWIDSASMVLLGSEAHLVNLPRRGTAFRAAGCTLLYRQVFPTLVTLQQAGCVSRLQSRPPTTTVGRWQLIEFRFLVRTPSDPEPPRPDP